MLRTVYHLVGRIRARRRLAQWAVAPGARVDGWGVRGAAGGSLEVGAGSLVSARISYEVPGARVTIGARTFIGRSHLVVRTGITIGDDVLISWGVTLVDHDSHSLRFSERAADVRDWAEGRKDWSKVRTAPIHVGDRAWIGFNATVLRGVTIGQGAVVGAGAIVTKDVAPWTVVAGSPARLIRELGPDER